MIWPFMKFCDLSWTICRNNWQSNHNLLWKVHHLHIWRLLVAPCDLYILGLLLVSCDLYIWRLKVVPHDPYIWRLLVTPLISWLIAGPNNITHFLTMNRVEKKTSDFNAVTHAYHSMVPKNCAVSHFVPCHLGQEYFFSKNWNTIRSTF